MRRGAGVGMVSCLCRHKAAARPERTCEGEGNAASCHVPSQPHSSTLLTIPHHSSDGQPSPTVRLCSRALRGTADPVDLRATGRTPEAARAPPHSHHSPEGATRRFMAATVHATHQAELLERVSRAEAIAAAAEVKLSESSTVAAAAQSAALARQAATHEQVVEGRLISSGGIECPPTAWMLVHGRSCTAPARTDADLLWNRWRVYAPRYAGWKHTRSPRPAVSDPSHLLLLAQILHTSSWPRSFTPPPAGPDPSHLLLLAQILHILLRGFPKAPSRLPRGFPGASSHHAS